MLLKLLDSPGSEIITSRDHHLKVILLKKIGDFGERSGFTHAVDSDKHDSERFFGVQDLRN